MDRPLSPYLAMIEYLTNIQSTHTKHPLIEVGPLLRIRQKALIWKMGKD